LSSLDSNIIETSLSSLSDKFYISVQKCRIHWKQVLQPQPPWPPWPTPSTAPGTWIRTECPHTSGNVQPTARRRVSIRRRSSRCTCGKTDSTPPPSLPGGNLIDILWAAFWYKSIFCAVFLFLLLCFVIFWLENIGAKAACEIDYKLRFVNRSQTPARTKVTAWSYTNYPIMSNFYTNMTFLIWSNSRDCESNPNTFSSSLTIF